MINTPTPAPTTNPIEPALLNEILMSSSMTILYTDCKVAEMVIALDDKPLDQDFIDTYVCDECESD